MIEHLLVTSLESGRLAAAGAAQSARRTKAARIGSAIRPKPRGNKPMCLR
jgi:hypothetical protein